MTLRPHTHTLPQAQPQPQPQPQPQQHKQKPQARPSPRQSAARPSLPPAVAVPSAPIPRVPPACKEAGGGGGVPARKRVVQTAEALALARLQRARAERGRTERQLTGWRRPCYAVWPLREAAAAARGGGVGTVPTASMTAAMA